MTFVRCIFRKMARQMEEVGGTLDHVVTMTGFITEVRYNLDFVEIRKEFFSEDSYPASTLVTVQALNRPEAGVNGMIVDVQHPTAGDLRLVGCPVRTTTSPRPSTPPPLQGQHTEEVLKELGE